jgi:transcriptional regulator with XRE-family HTH domain
MRFNARRLRELREKHKMSQYQVSFETSVEQHTIWHLENGSRKNPSFNVVEKIADRFKVNMAYFL